MNTHYVEICMERASCTSYLLRLKEIKGPHHVADHLQNVHIIKTYPEVSHLLHLSHA